MQNLKQQPPTQNNSTVLYNLFLVCTTVQYGPSMAREVWLVFEYAGTGSCVGVGVENVVGFEVAAV